MLSVCTYLWVNVLSQWMWSVYTYLWVNVLSQWMWSVCTYLWVNVLSQWMWSVYTYLWVNVLSQWMWSVYTYLWVNVLSHCGHRCGLSPECCNMWFFKFSADRNLKKEINLKKAKPEWLRHSIFHQNPYLEFQSNFSRLRFAASSRFAFFPLRLRYSF